MNIEEEILFNKFGQEVYEEEKLMTFFLACNLPKKREILNGLVYLIIQSKVTKKDIDGALKNARLKPTYTPCVIIQKGLSYGTFQRIIALPEYELGKSFRLLMHLFKIGYLRRYKEEKNNPNKWWYWDLSQESNLINIRKYNVSKQVR